MFKVKVSDGIMEIKITPSLNEKLTEEEFERLVTMYVVFYSYGHNGTFPSSEEVQSYIDDIICDYNEENNAQ